MWLFTFKCIKLDNVSNSAPGLYLTICQGLNSHKCLVVTEWDREDADYVDNHKKFYGSALI